MMVASLPFLWHERELVKKLKKAGAISKETAKTVEELGLSRLEIREIRRISRYTLSKTIKEITDEEGGNRYYVTQ